MDLHHILLPKWQSLDRMLGGCPGEYFLLFLRLKKISIFDIFYCEVFVKYVSLVC